MEQTTKNRYKPTPNQERGTTGVLLSPSCEEISYSLKLIFENNLHVQLMISGQYELMEVLLKTHINSSLDRMTLAEIFKMIAQLKLKRSISDKALAYAWQAISYASAGTQGEIIVAESRLIIVEALIFKKHFKRAASYLKSSVASSLAVTCRIFWAKAALCEAKISLFTGDLEQAAAALTRSKRILDGAPNSLAKKDLETMIMASLSFYYLISSDYKEATSAVRKLRELATNEKNSEGTFYADAMEIWLLAVSGKPCEALEIFSSLYFIRESNQTFAPYLHFLGVLVFYKNGMHDQAEKWNEQLENSNPLPIYIRYLQELKRH